MQRRPALTAVGALSVLAVLLLGAGATATPTRGLPPPSFAQRWGLQQVPKRYSTPAAAGGLAQVDPYLALVPDARRVNWAYWQARSRLAGRARAARLAAQAEAARLAARAGVARAGVARAGAAQLAGARIGARGGAAVQPVFVDELEPDQTVGGNDQPSTAQHLPRFGLAPSRVPSARVPSARVLGTLAYGPVPVSFAPARGDDGSIPKATDVRLTGAQQRTRTTGRIGDGPHGLHGDSTGDFDFYKITAGKAGQRLVVDIDTPATTGKRLDSVLTLYDAHGHPLLVNDDDGVSLDSRLMAILPKSGTYYVCVGSFGAATPRDPFRSGSGAGIGSEGPYAVTFGLDAEDLDYYRIDLHRGDVLGASVRGAARELDLRDPDGRLRIGSTQDRSGSYPPTSPLPGGGNAVLAYVADRDGPHTIEVTGGAGSYDLTLQAYRPGAESRGASSVQTIFLDFDGAQLNTKVFGGFGVRTLSPFRAFLGRWGLRANQENAVINAITRTVKDNLDQDLGAGVAVRILNSRDTVDPFGQPDVSRVILGGTADQLGYATVGIAQSVDPGNFDTEETAIVLMDNLSAPAGVRSAANPSLNAYFGPTSNRVAFVGQAVGNAASHEIGHLLGSWHTTAFDARPNLMDQGGNYPALWGVGPDGIGGTADDVDVDFGSDRFNPVEGFTGWQNTAAVTRWGLSGRR